MVSLVRSILDGRENVLALQEGVAGEDVFDGSPSSKKFENIGDTDPKAANTGTSTTLSLFNRDALKTLRGHDLTLAYATLWGVP